MTFQETLETVQMTHAERNHRRTHQKGAQMMDSVNSFMISGSGISLLEANMLMTINEL